MDLELRDRVAIVTGGGLGIGKAVARSLVLEGAQVVISSRRQSMLEQTADELRRQTGGRVEPIVVDTTDMERVDKMVADTLQRLGRIDILVNGAAAPGGMVRSALDEANDEALLMDLNTKVVGYFRCSKAVAPAMKSSKYGRIINIGGLTGRGSKRLSGMRNVAICHMTKTLSDQLGPHGITVNVIHPGVTQTEHIHELYAEQATKRGVTSDQIEAEFIQTTPIRRVIQPEEIGRLVSFLASPLAGGITGESIAIDGGITRGIFL